MPVISEESIRTAAIHLFISKKETIILREVELELIKKITNNEELTRPAGVILQVLEELVDVYFTVLEEIRETLDLSEDKIIKKPDKEIIKKIFSLKKDLIFLHKGLIGNKEVLLSMEKVLSSELSKRDLEEAQWIYEEFIQLIDMEEVYRDILTDSVEIYLSSISNNLNSIMKTLTIITAFIMVPTLVAGIYGMNFPMPELSWKLGYPWALGVMLLSIILLYLFFRKKGWVGKD